MVNRKIPERQLTQRVIGGFAAWTNKIPPVFDWTRQRAANSVFLKLCIGDEDTVKDDFAGELFSASWPHARRHLLFPAVATRFKNKVLLASLSV